MMNYESLKSKVKGPGEKKSPEPVGFGTGFLHPSQAVAGFSNARL